MAPHPAAPARAKCDPRRAGWIRSLVDVCTISGGAVRGSLSGPAIGLIAQGAGLAALALAAGLGPVGLLIGAACALTMAAALARGLGPAPEGRLGPASWVTL